MEQKYKIPKKGSKITQKQGLEGKNTGRRDCLGQLLKLQRGHQGSSGSRAGKLMEAFF